MYIALVVVTADVVAVAEYADHQVIQRMMQYLIADINMRVA